MKKFLLVCGLLAVFPLFPSLAYAEDKFDIESLSHVQAQLEQDHLIINHDGQSYFVPSDDYEGLKSSETNNELLGGTRVAHVFGVQVHIEKEMENLGIVLICEKDKKGLRILKKVLTDEYFEGFGFQKVGGAGTWLLVRSGGGAHCRTLKVLAFQNGEFVTLFDKNTDGSVAPEFELSKNGVPQVRVGWPNWDDPNWDYASGERLWEVHVWNGKKFVYDKALSTSSEKDLFAEVNKYVQRYHTEVKKLEQTKNDTKQKN